LAGSFSNLLFAIFGGLILSVSPSPPLLFFVICNIFLGTLNLIPMSFFDGGKALRLLIYDSIHPDKAFYFYRFLDILSAFIFVAFSIFLIFISNFNISVCAVMLYAAISTLSNQNRQKTP
jgi:membrane-associated protease RseP (regulator of RpoE activity)